jgi:hypothetical protein
VKPVIVDGRNKACHSSNMHLEKTLVSVVGASSGSLGLTVRIHCEKILAAILDWRQHVDL